MINSVGLVCKLADGHTAGCLGGPPTRHPQMPGVLRLVVWVLQPPTGFGLLASLQTGQRSCPAFTRQKGGALR